MRRTDASTLYSIVIRRGPDVSHYDVVAEDEAIRFIHLGEHWESFRPRTGMQKRMDLLVYSIRKRRRRHSAEARYEDFTIDYCSIRSIVIVRDRDGELGRVVIVTKSGGRVEMEYPAKIHDIVKEFVKIVKSRIESKCSRERVP